jgi:hypothetical protein
VKKHKNLNKVQHNQPLNKVQLSQQQAEDNKDQVGELGYLG